MAIGRMKKIFGATKMEIDATDVYGSSSDEVSPREGQIDGMCVRECVCVCVSECVCI